MADERRLNLDEYAPEPAYVMLDGKDHKIEAQSVEVWLKFLKGRDDLVKLAELDGEDESRAAALMKGNIDIITMVCPDIPEERLMKLSLPGIRAFTSFIAQEMRGSAVAVTDDDAEKDSAETDTGEAGAPAQKN